MIKYAVAIEGLENVAALGEITPRIEKILVATLNKSATHMRTDAARRILSQVNFPASYLQPASKRLFVAQQATKQSPMAIVRGRSRPTSLARFSRQKLLPAGQRPRGGEVAVTVKPGHTVKIARAFLIKLKSGTDPTGNIGLAVRTSGGKPPNAYAPKEIGKNLWLLYGPSVDQVLFSTRNQGGVATELMPDTIAYMNAEFQRLYDTDMWK